MERKIITVLGEIEPERAGITLLHEHILLDGTSWYVEPEEISKKILAHSKVTIGLLGKIRTNPMMVLDNMVLDEIEVAVDELKEFKAIGGKTVVSLTSRGLGRDPATLARVARETGLNIVMGSGYYTHTSHPPELKEKRIGEIRDEIIKDITEGVGSSKIRAGIIGEIGVSNPMHPEEEKVLHAAARAQRKTGASIFIHPGIEGGTELSIIDVLEEENVDLNRVIMGHQDSRYPLRDDENKLRLHETMTKRGIYCMYDSWGSGRDYWEVGVPPDYDRIYAAKRLIERGCINRLLFSHDVCTKTQLARYGGYGYTHLFTNIPKMMMKTGLTKEEMGTLFNKVFVENPKGALTLS